MKAIKTTAELLKFIRSKYEINPNSTLILLEVTDKHSSVSNVVDTIDNAMNSDDYEYWSVVFSDEANPHIDEHELDDE